MSRKPDVIHAPSTAALTAPAPVLNDIDDPDSDLALACSALHALELLLCTSDIDIGGGLSELIEPIRLRVVRAREAYQAKGVY